MSANRTKLVGGIVYSERRENKRKTCEAVGLKTFKQLRKWKKRQTKLRMQRLARQGAANA